MTPRWTVRTVGELRALLAGLDDEAHIEWAYDGPEECCNEHVHDITEIHGCDAVVEATAASAQVMLSGGFP